MEPRGRKIFAEKAVIPASASLCEGLQVSQHSPWPQLPAGLISSSGGGSREPAVCTAFPPASLLHQDSLRGDSSEQIEGEGLR